MCAAVCSVGLGLVPIALPCALAAAVLGGTVAVAFALGGEVRAQVERERTWQGILTQARETFEQTTQRTRW